MSLTFRILCNGYKIHVGSEVCGNFERNDKITVLYEHETFIKAWNGATAK